MKKYKLLNGIIEDKEDELIKILESNLVIFKCKQCGKDVKSRNKDIIKVSLCYECTMDGEII